MSKVDTQKTGADYEVCQYARYYRLKRRYVGNFALTVVKFIFLIVGQSLFEGLNQAIAVVCLGQTGQNHLCRIYSGPLPLWG